MLLQTENLRWQQNQSKLCTTIQKRADYSRHHQTVLFERRPPHEHSDIKKQAKIPLAEGRKSGLLARRYGSLRRILACRNAKNPLKQRVSWSEPRGIRTRDTQIKSLMLYRLS